MSLPLVLVPVKELDRAKERLAQALSPQERAALAEATLLTVLEACRGAGMEARVLTSDERAAAIAAELGVAVQPESAEVRGLNAQLEAALAALPEAPGGVLILHADLPLASAAALWAFVAAAPQAPSVTLLPSPDGGTNAMLLRPLGRFALAYGVGSCAKHRAAAEAAGLQVTEVQDERLALDLDTPADLDAFLKHPGHEGTRAAAVIERLAGARGGSA